MSIADKNNNSDKVVFGAVSFLVKEFVENGGASYVLGQLSNSQKQDYANMIKYMVLDSSKQFKESFLSNDSFVLMCMLGGSNKEFYNLLMKHSFWRKEVKSIKVRLKKESTTDSLIKSLSRSHYNNQVSNFFNLLSNIETFPVSGLYNYLIKDYAQSRHYLGVNQRRFILEKHAKKFPLKYRMHMIKKCFTNKDSDVSRYENDIRSEFYSAFISAGLLNSKLARKMRSETSKYSSLAAVKELINSEDKYPNYLQLLEEFTDSNHDIVLEELANYAPISIVKFLVGKQCVSRLVQRRMERYRREMEEQNK